MTGIRGLAAVYVMFYHYANREVGSGILKVVIDHGYVAVDLFFSLSGFVMALTYRGLFAERSVWAAYPHFLGRRLARIYPLYLAMTVAVMVLAGLGVNENLPRDTVPAYVANLILVQAWVGISSLDFPAWSISTEWAAYMVFPALLILTLRSRPVAAVLLTVAIATGLTLLALLPGWTLLGHPEREGGTLNIFLGAGPMIRCLLEFTLGLLAFRLSRSAPGRFLAEHGWAGLVIAGLVVAGLCSPRLDLLVAAGFPLLVVAVSRDQGPVARVLGHAVPARLGLWSYAIYLLHMQISLVTDWIAQLLARHGVADALLLAKLLSCVLTILAASVVYEVIEKPGRRFVQHVLLRPGRVPREGAGAAAR